MDPRQSAHPLLYEALKCALMPHTNNVHPDLPKETTNSNGHPITAAHAHKHRQQRRPLP